MVKRTSLVWKRPELSAAEFRRLWLGEHMAHAKRLPGLSEYVIDFVKEGPAQGPAGIATVRFESRAALDAAFGEPALKENLLRTRDEFAHSVQLLFVDEEVIVPRERMDEQ
jgi:uncharacterized protein (TIGR02118 family)